MESVSETTGSVKPRSRQHRSAISNGNRLFQPELTDGRSGAMRRYRDVLEQIEADLGGGEHLSEGQRQLARRAATLCTQAEIMEASAVSGREFDVQCFTTIVNCLRRLLETVGLERRSRDITPSLSNYLQAKAGPP